jgi:LacI family transcriptional regulator
MKKTTIYDIAKKLNLSAATVSRSLNNHPRISSKTKKEVLRIAQELHYEQNHLAKALQSGKSFIVGVIVPRIDNNFLSSVIRGIEDKLKDFDYHVIICQTHEDEEKEIENINTLLNIQVDGFLLSTCLTSIKHSELLDKIIKKNIPLVYFDRKMEIEGASSVIIDDFKGAYLATMRLIDNGATRIAHFSGNREIQIYNDRLNGYLQALNDAGLCVNLDYVIQVKSSLDDGVEAMDKLFNLEFPPDALFSSSDFAAFGAIQYLKSKNINIPEDFLVFGFGNENFTKFDELSISSVNQFPLEMGRITAEVFLDIISKSTIKNKVVKNIVLEPELIERKSSLKVFQFSGA